MKYGSGVLCLPVFNRYRVSFILKLGQMWQRIVIIRWIYRDHWVFSFKQTLGNQEIQKNKSVTNIVNNLLHKIQVTLK